MPDTKPVAAPATTTATPAAAPRRKLSTVLDAFRRMVLTLGSVKLDFVAVKPDGRLLYVEQGDRRPDDCDPLWVYLKAVGYASQATQLDMFRRLTPEVSVERRGADDKRGWLVAFRPCLGENDVEQPPTDVNDADATIGA